MRCASRHSAVSLTVTSPFGLGRQGLIGLILLTLMAQAVPVFSAPSADSSQSNEPRILYIPPKKFMPRARLGGTVRGSDGLEPIVQPLVPDHVGFTSQETPVLNWYLSKPTPHEVRFTLIDDKSVKPIFEAPIPAPKEAGIFSIRTRDLDLTLQPGVQYRWYVSIVQPAPFSEIVTGGIIERCELSDCLIVMDARMTCSVQSVTENARAGMWYDAMGCLCALIDADPENVSLRRLRASLLSQVGLHLVAEWDLRAVPAAGR
ncbi:conserved protein of unknown function [Nitrospira japonica]|uniref:DUF928 domain-containing protein n=1 Tax=Nitrospira japonica TaxID=1325564 RepID=A0A1W1I7U1_9BACT|nr:DUF928 domain-containing protein [Nitrospira japonica]SLM49092.1 conserved protein of unknown function [Nitrospira japonica]